MRRILPHLDDVGSTAGSVTAWRDLRTAGVVRSASVMVPCPWYRAAVEDWHADPAQDLGIHLTLTAEWRTYRWRPMIGVRGGLTDGEGFFHRRPDMVAAHVDPQAVEDEMAAQVERALADGIRPSHLDAHMGTAFLFLPQLLSVATRYGIPPLLCRDFAPLFRLVRCDGPDPETVAAALETADARGWPIFDSFLMGFVPDGQSPEPFYADLIATAPAGLSFYACHANAPGEMAAIAAHHVWPREAEHRLYADPTSRHVFSAARLVTFRDITTDTTREDPAPCA